MHEKQSFQKTTGTNPNARHVNAQQAIGCTKRQKKKKKKSSQVMPTETIEANWRQSECSQSGFLEVLPGGGRKEQNQVRGSLETYRQKCLATGQFQPHAHTHRDIHPCQHAHARAHTHAWLWVSEGSSECRTHTRTQVEAP